MTAKVAGFSDADRWAAETAIEKRHGRRVEVEPAGSDTRLGPASRHRATT